MAEGRKTIRRQKVAIFGLITALVFTLAGFAIASAAVSNSDGTVNACYKNNNGNLRVQVKPCVAGKETALQVSRSVPIYAVVNFDGSVSSSKHLVSVDQFVGGYHVHFDRDVSKCAIQVSSERWFGSDLVYGQHDGTFVQVVTLTADGNDTPTTSKFDVTVTC